MTENKPDNNFDFDFNGDANRQKQQRREEAKIKHEKFLAIGKRVILAISASALLIGGPIAIYSTYQANIDKKIAIAEKTIKTVPKDNLLNYIEGEKAFVQSTFMNNQMLINDHGKYKEVIEALNLGNQLAARNAANGRVYKDTVSKINLDQNVIQNLYAASLSKDRDLKIRNYLDIDSNMQKLEVWNTAYNSKKFQYAADITNLNKNLINDLKILEKTQKEVIAHVKERVKNKDFDLNEAQNKFSNDISKEADKEVNELKQTKKELTEASDLAAEDNDGNIITTNPNLQNLLTDTDITDAENAMNVYKKEALNQISSDKNKVEEMLSKVEKDNALATKTENNNNPTTVINHHTGPSFLDYYMMYYWMNAMQPKATTIVNNNYGNSATVKSNVVNPITQNSQVKTYKSIDVPKSNIYDMNNQNSHLNKSLSDNSAIKNASIGQTGNGKLGKPAITPKPDLSVIKAKIESVKAKAAQARSIKAAEVSKVKSVSSSSGNKLGSKSAMAKSGMSGRSGGFGGRSGGFGG